MSKPTEAKPLRAPPQVSLTPGEPHPRLNPNLCPSPDPGQPRSSLSYSMWTCRTRSAPRSSSSDSRPVASGWRSLSCRECRLSSVTSQSCWVLLCSCRRHSLPWGSEGAGAGAQPRCEWGQGCSTFQGAHRGPAGHLRASGTPQPWSCSQGPASLGSLGQDREPKCP